MKTLMTFFAVVFSSWMWVAAEPPNPAMDPVVLAVQKVLPAVVNINT